jgi:hypothetical protein
MSSSTFHQGRLYSRRKDLHAVYGGQQQGGYFDAN